MATFTSHTTLVLGSSSVSKPAASSPSSHQSPHSFEAKSHTISSSAAAATSASTPSPPRYQPQQKQQQQHIQQQQQPIRQQQQHLQQQQQTIRQHHPKQQQQQQLPKPPTYAHTNSINSTNNTSPKKPNTQVSPAVMATETINSVSAGIEEEELLYKKLSETEDFNERRMIRSKLKEIRLQKTSDWNKSKEIRDSLKTDANQLRQEQSKQQKLRKMESFDKLAKENREKGQTTAELAFRERQKKNEAEKQRKLDEYKEIGKVMSKAYHQGSEIAAQNSINVGNRNKEMKMQGFEDQQTSRNVEHGMDGSVTTTTTSSSSSRDGNRTTIKQSKNVTTIGGVGGTSYGLNKSADEIAREICDRFTNGTGGGGGVVIGGEVGVTIRRTPIVPEGVAQRAVKARSWGACRSGAMAAFKQMDSSNNGSARPNYLGGGKGVQRSASTVKAMLLEWVKQMVKGYDNVDVTNFSTSWNNGMAFCALIHRFFPKSFEYAKLNPKNRRFNFTLAFEVAEKFAGISPLLDVEDMVRMKNPDWKCVFTTVQVYYRWFKSEENKSPGTPGQPISPLVTSEVKIES